MDAPLPFPSLPADPLGWYSAQMRPIDPALASSRPDHPAVETPQQIRERVKQADESFRRYESSLHAEESAFMRSLRAFGQHTLRHIESLDQPSDRDDIARIEAALERQPGSPPLS
jgi:hypothetical protein